MINKSITNLIKTLKQTLSIQSHQLKYFASFDCHNCSKQSAHPECNACHRMVNYFNIFNMYHFYYSVLNSTMSTGKLSQ